MWFLVIDMTTDSAHLLHFYPLSRAQESGMRSGWRVKGGVTGLRFLRGQCWGAGEIIPVRKANLLCAGHRMACFYLDHLISSSPQPCDMGTYTTSILVLRKQAQRG